MFKVNVNAAKAEAMGVALSDIVQTAPPPSAAAMRERLQPKAGRRFVQVRSVALPDTTSTNGVRNALAHGTAVYLLTNGPGGSTGRLNATTASCHGDFSSGGRYWHAMSFMVTPVSKLPVASVTADRITASGKRYPQIRLLRCTRFHWSVLALAALYESWSFCSAMLVVPLGRRYNTGHRSARTAHRLLPCWFADHHRGLSAKNAIRLSEFAEMMVKEGKTPIEAIIEAARMRLLCPT